MTTRSRTAPAIAKGLLVSGLNQLRAACQRETTCDLGAPLTADLRSLVRRLDPEDGEVLLREYATLHPEHVELNRLLSEHWSALCEMGEVRGDAPS